MGLSLLLTFLFGRLGLMYTSIGWGIAFFLIDVVAAFFALGFSIFICQMKVASFYKLETKEAMKTNHLF